jgi:hypothetical protein
LLLGGPDISKKDSNFAPIQAILTVFLGLRSDSLAPRLKALFSSNAFGTGLSELRIFFQCYWASLFHGTSGNSHNALGLKGEPYIKKLLGWAMKLKASENFK